MTVFIYITSEEDGWIVTDTLEDDGVGGDFCDSQDETISNAETRRSLYLAMGHDVIVVRESGSVPNGVIQLEGVGSV